MLTEIGREVGFHYATVGRIINASEGGKIIQDGPLFFTPILVSGVFENRKWRWPNSFMENRGRTTN